MYVLATFWANITIYFKTHKRTLSELVKIGLYTHVGKIASYLIIS